MIVLVSGATATLRRHAHTGHFGQLFVPRAGNTSLGLPWACDNDAFKAFDPVRFRRMLAKLEGVEGCLFVACPDVVCDPVATLDRFREWRPEIIARGFPIAFVGQDDCESTDLPWDEFDAFFVGGSDAWKESRATMRLCIHARELGKWVHVGRVNSYRRLRKLFDWGCVDSIDGRSFSAFSDIYIPKAIGWLAKLENQKSFLS